MSHKRRFLITSGLLASAFCAAVILPSLEQRMEDAYPFQGIEIMGSDAEEHYAGRVREAYDGYWMLGNTYYSAPKDQPGMMSMIPETPIAFVGKALGMNAITAFMLSKIVLSFALVLLFIGFAFAVTGQPWIALSASVSLLFAGTLLSAPWDIKYFLSPSTASFELLRFSRAINPQWSVSWTLIVLLGMAIWLKNRGRRPLMLAAAALSICVYSYVYAWTFAATAIGLLTLWYLIKRDRRRVVDLVWFWGTAIVLSAPYFFYLRTIVSHPLYAESSMRLGMIASHAPVFGMWMFAFVAFSILTKKWWPATWPLLPCIALGGIIAINQQVITGRFIVPHHYHWYFIQPLSGLFAVALLLELMRRLLQHHKMVFGWIMGLMMLSSLCIGIEQQLIGYNVQRDKWGKIQKMAPVIEYIGEHYVQGTAVYSHDKTLLDLLPVHTSVDVYASNQANNYLVSMVRAREVYFFDLWLQGVSPQDAEEKLMTTKRAELSSALYGIYYRELLGQYDAIPDSVVREHAGAYAKYLELSPEAKVSRYPLDLIVTTRSDPSTAQWKQLLSRGQSVFKDGDCEIIDLHQKKR